jgi:cobalt/nickel transport system ATP-binding protein
VNTIIAPPTIAALEISNLSFAYPDGWQALREVCFSLQPGEKVAILGPNGAGKSTLLLHLNGLLHGSGDVKIMGHRVIENDKKTLASIRAMVGLVFQDPDDQLFMPTVFDDVAFGPINLGWPEDEVRHRVAHALEDVGLVGYETRAPYHLSGGEKRRAAIATVLAMEPELLVLDEPTSGLDPAGRLLLIELLRRLSPTLLIASHDLDMVLEVCERCLLMDGGRIVAEGPPQDLFEDEATLAVHRLERPSLMARREA